MTRLKAILFDADGVMIIPGELFSVRYARQRGFDPQILQSFFSGPFRKAMAGKADLKQLIKQHSKEWELNCDVDEFLDRWFNSENCPNTQLVKLIEQLRTQGIQCYLATNQEKFRTAYIKNVMFPNVFDGIFSSCEIGAIKPSKDYFQAVLGKLKLDGITTNQIIYFDDSQTNIDAANLLGIQGHLYHNVARLKGVLS